MFRSATTRCPYCSFTVVADRLDLVDRYGAAITSEMSALGRPSPVSTIFIGGGNSDAAAARIDVAIVRRDPPMAATYRTW